MIQIKHRLSGAVLFEGEYESLRAAAIAAAKSDAYLAGANLADAYLARAYLAGADLAGANLADANLADANLADADLAGANLGGANLGGADLAGANLAGANLGGANLAGANLAGANLAGADLADADLAGANLADANLARAYLADARNVPEGTQSFEPSKPYERKPRAERLAERAAEYRARHPEVPVVEALDAKILNVIESGNGKLQMDAWHRCKTTHCRAGWAITLAGEAGQKLEDRFGPQRAGTMIYRASTGRVPNFFASDWRALEDIREQAATQIPSP